MTSVRSVFGALASVCYVLSAAETSSEPLSGNTVLVEIDGARLSLNDLERKGAASLFQARNSFYEAHRKAIDEFINEYLLERQARRENVTVAELLERHVNRMAQKDPSDEALRVYYEGLDTKEPYEAVREKIVDVIRQRRLAKVKGEYLKSLRGQAAVAIVLAPPRAPISMKNTPVRGLPGAPVTLVEYADYECPYCQKAQPVLSQIKAEFQDKVAMAYKDVPLPMHGRAQKAAEAARCAGVQGRYWEFHDQLYQSQQLDIPDLKALARVLKLDGRTFDVCLDSGKQAEAVKADLAEAQALGLPGTPAIFVNGRFLNPNAPVTYEALRQMVEEELRASAERSNNGAPASGGAGLQERAR